MKFGVVLSAILSILGRPPRGGRGLKSRRCGLPPVALGVAPLAGGVD